MQLSGLLRIGRMDKGRAAIIVVIILMMIFILKVDSNFTSTANEEFESEQAIKLFDFERFKTLYGKSYSNEAERLLRRQLFFGRAIRVFVALISYQHRLIDSYLSINNMSDWTSKELRRRFNARNFRRNSNKLRGRRAAKDAKHQAVGSPNEPLQADIEGIEIRIGAKLKKNSGMKRHSRRKRQVDELQRRQISLADVIGRSADEIDETSAPISSNNPHYEAPEFQSSASLRSSKTIISDREAPIRESQKSSVSEFFKSLVTELGGLTDMISRKKPVMKKPVENDQLFIDHRTTNCLFRPRNQGDCSSCYVFSTISLYEWLFCRQTGQLVAFSEQFTLDCGHRTGLPGCEGGQESDVGLFVAEFGLELRNNYPYKSKVESCPYSNETDSKLMGYLKVDDPELIEISVGKYFDELLKRTPILVGIFIGPSFNEYGGGVDSAKDCKAEKEEDDQGHAVLIVGTGRVDGKHYWLIKNSHGPDWGERGYYKLNKQNNCLMDGVGYYSQARFNWASEFTKNSENLSKTFKAHPMNPNYIPSPALTERKNAARAKRENDESVKWIKS